MKRHEFDIVIVASPPWAISLPPLGVAYLSTNLGKRGMNCFVYDLNLELYEIAAIAKRRHWDLEIINNFSPEDIGDNLFEDFKVNLSDLLAISRKTGVLAFSVNSHISCAFSAKVARCMKNVYPDKIIIFGGPGCYHSWDRRFVNKGAVDFFIIGEGEHALFNLLEAIFQNRGVKNIAGVIDNNQEDNYGFTPAETIRNLDELTHPDFREFDLNRYQKYLSAYPKDRALPILISRGCVNRCSFCIDYYMQGNFRSRRPEDVVKEIIFHMTHNHTQRFEFNDLLCNGNLNRLEAMCDLIIKNGLKISWSSYATIRRDMNKELFVKMRKAGCVSLCYGMESASDKILGLMNKKYTSHDAQTLLTATKEAGISPHINIIVGFPQEEDVDYIKTYDFLIENKKYIDNVANVSSFVLMPASEVGVYPKRYGIERLNGNLGWVDNNGLDLEKRIFRLNKISQLITELNISTKIINIPEYAKVPEVDIIIPCKNEDMMTLLPSSLYDRRERGNLFLEKVRRNKIYRFLIILFLLSYTVFIQVYFYLLGIIRKIVKE